MVYDKKAERKKRDRDRDEEDSHGVSNSQARCSRLISHYLLYKAADYD